MGRLQSFSGLCVVSLFAGLVGCSPEPSVEMHLELSAAEIEAGQRVVRLQCATCHGIDDKTEDEMKAMMGFKEMPTSAENRTAYFDESNATDAIDWRSKGAVNHIVDQKNCGSCWAFSTTAAMEGAHKIKTGKLLKLSEQELVDCDKGDDGCNGGLEVRAFKYL